MQDWSRKEDIWQIYLVIINDLLLTLKLFHFSDEHKESYFEERLELWHHWLSHHWLMVPKNCLVPIVLQNIFLCVQQKKEAQTGLQQLEGE